MITKQNIYNYYNNDLSLEINKVQKLVRNIYLHKNWPPNAAFRRHLYFWAQQSRNGTHRIVGYQRQLRIHLCWLHNSIRRRYLRRQEEKQNLDSDVPWCLPALECCLRRQHFRTFGRSQSRQQLPVHADSHAEWQPLSVHVLEMCAYISEI